MHRQYQNDSLRQPSYSKRKGQCCIVPYQHPTAHPPNIRVDELVDVGLEKCNTDAYVFNMKANIKVILSMSVHVGDIVVGGTKDNCDKVFDALAKTLGRATQGT